MAHDTAAQPSAGAFTPKLVTVWREGYGSAQLGHDALAGLTVAIVALPLSMAIAIASHAPPAAGLITAIIGGFLISALGGSRFQIGGPAGAFIVLVAGIIDRFGMDGLLLATIMAGAMMLLLGMLRLGNLIRLVPHPVIVGFSAGIAVIIAVSQLKDLLGLVLPQEPAAMLPKLAALFQAAPSVNYAAFLLASASLAIIVLQRKLKPRWPGFLLAVTICSILAAMFHLPVETIATRFGELPHGLSMPRMPTAPAQGLGALALPAISIALLGSIESLLSALVADRMKGRQHRSNIELVAQGLANIACGLCGGITATGTIARTATNVRAGAVSPVSGMLHAVYLLLFMLIAAPLAGYIPLCALAAILMVVAWNMAERRELRLLMRDSQTASAVLLTIGLTVFHDLLLGIAAGTALFYAFHFLRRQQP